MGDFSTLWVKQGGKLVPLDRDGMHRYIATLGDGEEGELTLGPTSAEAHHTRQQEKGFHAMIAPWAKEEGHAIEDLKRDLLAEIFGLREHTDVLTGVVVMLLVEPHTSKLSKTKYNELIERTLEIAARCGHVLIAPSEYRERRARADAAIAQGAPA